MKAITYQKYGGPEVFELREVQKPVPTENEVLIKTHAVSINPFEWHHMRGKPLFARMSMGFFKPKHSILGMDVAGTVISTGQSVTKFTKGDEVFGYSEFGGLAEFVCVAEDNTLHKPPTLSFAEAAAIPLAGITALQSLKNVINTEPGQKALINGSSGGVGSFAVQIAKAFQLNVTGVCSTRNVELVKSLGADRVIDYKREDVTQLDDQYDLVIDNVGNLSLKDLKQLTNEGGTGVVVGFTTMKNVLPILMKGKPAKGKIGVLEAKVTKSDLEYLLKLVEERKVRPVLDRHYPLEEIVEAMTYLETLHAPGKVIIDVNGTHADMKSSP